MTNDVGGRTRTAVVVGNPKPASRTLKAAVHVATALTGDAPDVVLDLATLGPALLDWADPQVTELARRVGDSDVVVVASPTHHEDPAAYEPWLERTRPLVRAFGQAAP